MKVVGIDPGTKRIGLACIENSHLPVEMDTVSSLAATKGFINRHNPDWVVIESFIKMGNERSALTNEAIHVCMLIGRLEEYCYHLQIPVHLSPNRNHGMGAKITGIEVKKSDPLNDRISALNHAVWFWHSKLKRART